MGEIVGSSVRVQTVQDPGVIGWVKRSNLEVALALDGVPAVSPMAPAAVAPAAEPRQPWHYKERTRGPLVDLVSSGGVSFLKGAYFVERYEKGRKWQPRQEVDPSYYWEFEVFLPAWNDITDMYCDDFSYSGYSFCYAISYGWTNANHPDPERYHAKRVASITKQLWERMEREGCWSATLGGLPKDVAVFLDFMSLFQYSDGVAKPWRCRSPEQTRKFYIALANMDLIYAHRDITTIVLLGLPLGVSPPIAQRGWPFFEQSIAEVKPDINYVGKSGGAEMGIRGVEMVMVFVESWDPEAPWSWAGIFHSHIRVPLSPTEFRAELSKRNFTNGRSDREQVERLYDMVYASAQA